MGTRVPVKTGVPERISGETVTCLDMGYVYINPALKSSFLEKSHFRPSGFGGMSDNAEFT